MLAYRGLGLFLVITVGTGGKRNKNGDEKKWSHGQNLRKAKDSGLHFFVYKNLNIQFQGLLTENRAIPGARLFIFAPPPGAVNEK